MRDSEPTRARPRLQGNRRGAGGERRDGEEPPLPNLRQALRPLSHGGGGKVVGALGARVEWRISPVAVAEPLSAPAERKPLSYEALDDLSCNPVATPAAKMSRMPHAPAAREFRIIRVNRTLQLSINRLPVR